MLQQKHLKEYLKNIDNKHFIMKMNKKWFKVYMIKIERKLKMKINIFFNWGILMKILKQ